MLSWLDRQLAARENKKSLDLALPKTHEMYVYLQFLGSTIKFQVGSLFTDESLRPQPLSLVVLGVVYIFGVNKSTIQGKPLAVAFSGTVLPHMALC